MSHKILIVDEDPALQKALRESLEESGFEVSIAEDGQAGLDMALQNHPDLILLDIVLPVMDGMTTLSKLRENEWGKNVSVILLTNLDDATKAAKAVENGVFDFLVKSQWSINDVVERVKHYFN